MDRCSDRGSHFWWSVTRLTFAIGSVDLHDGGEVGTHAELLEKKGEFYRLVEMQQEMSKIKAIAR